MTRGRGADAASDRTFVMIPSKVAFPEIGATPRHHAIVEVLRRLSRTDVIFHCARLNHVVGSQRPSADLAVRMVHFIGPSPRVLRRLDAFLRKYPPSRVVPIFRGQLMELMRLACIWAKDKPNDGTTFEGTEHQDARDDLLLALLLAGEIWGERVLPKSRLDAARSSEDVRLATLRRAYIENRIAPPLFRMHDRSLAVLQLLKEQLPHFDLWFQEDVGITVDDFRRVADALNWQYVERNELRPVSGTAGMTGVFSRASASGQTIRSREISIFLDRTSQSLDTLGTLLAAQESQRQDSPTESWDPLDWSLRNRPILVAPDGRMIVCDVVAFRSCLLENTVFQLTDSRRRKAAIDAFTKAIERYVALWFREIFPLQGGYRVEESVQVPDGGDVDVLVRVRDIALFVEVKAGFLRDDVAVPGREQDLREHLTQKVIRGAQQLARDVRIAAAGGAHVPATLRGVRLVFPLLVTNDTLLDNHVDRLVAEAFWDKMVPRPSDATWAHVGDARVACPALMSVAEVEDLAGLPPAFWLEHVMTYSTQIPGERQPLADHMASRRVIHKLNRQLQPSVVDAYMKESYHWFFNEALPEDLLDTVSE